MQALGKRLKELRIKAGLTQKDMSDFLGLGKSGYHRIESSKTDITLKHLLKIVAKFEISLDWLIMGKEIIEIDSKGFGEFYG